MDDASNTPSAGVEVTQADRNQAADFLERAGLLQSATHEYYAQGLMDSSLAVLAFARHRIAHAAPKHERVRADVAAAIDEALDRHAMIVCRGTGNSTLRENLLAIALATPPAPGEDVVLVPRVPTEAMMRAGADVPCVDELTGASVYSTMTEAKSIWLAMLAAAPSPAAP
jgi:hypothetical protein